MIQLVAIGRTIGDFQVTDKYGFDVDIATSSEVPDPMRFPIFFVWKGLSESEAQLQRLKLETKDSQEFLPDVRLSALRLPPPPVPIQPWELEKLKSISAQVLAAIEAGRYKNDFG